MLEKKFHMKGIGEMIDQHRKEMHEQFSQILSTIRESKFPEPEAPTFAITTKSGISTRDPPLPTLLQSTPTNHAEGTTEREGLEGAEISLGTSICFITDNVPYSFLEACFQPITGFNYGVHTLTLEDGTEIHMLAERKYPLTKETLVRMMSLKLITESASESAYNLLSKELASPKQTALGKYISNPLIVNSLLKTIWLSMHHVIAMKHWLFQSKRLLIYSMAGEDEFHDDNPPPPPPPVTPTQQAPHTLSTIKLPILKKGEYDIWAMKMEHYLGHTDYPIWEIIQKGNGPVQVSTDTNGQIRVLPPKTAEEILARERERKARTTLLMSIPEDHLAKFHKMTDAKEMWEAIKSRFGGNDESKKMQKYILKQQFESFSVSNSEGLHKGYDRFQSLLSQLEIHGAGVSTEDANQKFLRSLPASWSQVSLIMRTKPGVDTLSFDDLYKQLRVFESDIKGSTASSSSTQNVAFVSSKSTNSTNDVSTAYGVSTSSGHNSQKEGSSSYSDELKYSFFANQSSVAVISIRLKKFYKKTRRRLQFDAKEPVGFDKTKIEFFNCHNTGKFAREHRSKGNQESKRRDAGNMDIKQKTMGGNLENKRNLKLYQMSTKGHIWAWVMEIHKYIEVSYNYEKEVLESVFDSQTSDVEDSYVNDRFAKVEGMHAVPPPMTGIYMPFKSDFGIDESNFTYGSQNSLIILEKPSFAFVNTVKHVKTHMETFKEQNTCSPSPKANKRDWNGLMSKKLGLGYGFTKKACFVCGSFSHLIRDYEFHEKRMAKQVELNKKNGNVNAARQNPSSQAAETSTARKVNTARPIVNEIRQRSNFYKSHSPIRRPFNISIAPKANFTNHKVNTARDKTISVIRGYTKTAVKASAGCNWRPKIHYWNKVSKYNSGSKFSKHVNFKDPLGRPKSAMAWV
ncbi:hypothetical protein Tco_0722728 [Tanacetum coccineum]